MQPSLNLFDRLVELTAVNGFVHPFKIEMYLLHAILKNWNNSFRNFQSDILPSSLVNRIDGYVRKTNVVQPNIATYTIILDAAAHCEIPDERISFTEKLLERLIQECETNELVRPTNVTFGAVINAWAKSGNSEASEKAEALLRKIQALNGSDGWTQIKPNVILYTSVINGYAKTGNPDRAELLLREMYEQFTLDGNCDVKPNRRTFNTVLAAGSKSVAPNAGQAAQSLLRKMQQLGEEGILDTKPDVISYNTVLNAMARKGNESSVVDCAEALLAEMINLVDSSDDSSVSPNKVTLATIVRLIVWSSMDVSTKLHRIQNIVEMMMERGVSPPPRILEQVHRLKQQAHEC